jgi:hypothetical protein
MDLLIYETTHHETLPAMLDLASDYFNNVYVYLKSSSYENLVSGYSPEHSWPKANFIKQPDGQSNRLFIKEFFSTIRRKKIRHLHISTLDNNLLYIALQLILNSRVKVSISIQAINEYAAYRYDNLRDISEALAKQVIHQRIKACRVFFPMMVKHLNGLMPSTEPVYIPPRFFEENGDLPLSYKFRITIPGSLDPNRRDYHHVGEFFSEFLSAGYSQKPIELIVLGNASGEYGRKIISDLRKLESDSFKVISFDHYLSQTDYELFLRRSDLIWSPIHLETKGIRNTPEKYGHSTATGLTGDLLIAARPAMVPLGYIVPEHYENTLITYQSLPDLAGWVQYFLDGKGTEKYQRINRDLSFFSIQNFRSAFEKLMYF